jgi:hypothetical protein
VLAASAAAATTSKPYSVTITPGSVAAGAQVTFTVAITNQNPQQTLGSANLTVPAGFTLDAASIPAGAGTATVSGSTVQLRNLSLANGATVPVTVVADVPCSAGTASWQILAKQSNDFNGPPGNNFTAPPASSLVTTVSGACALHFFVQPADARVGQQITGSAFDPAGAGQLSVEVVDGSGARVTSSTASITLALGPGSSGSGVLSGTKTRSAVAGLATFTGLSIDQPGTYTLQATSPGLASATSNAFHVEQVAVPCTEDVGCTASISNSQTSNTVTAPGNGRVDQGFLALSYNVGNPVDCSSFGYTQITSAASTVVLSGPDRTKTLVETISKALMNASSDNGASHIQMCFGAPYSFLTRSGQQAQPVAGFTPAWYVGLLPDCGSAPCVSARNKDRSGQGIITVEVPAGALDPAFRP